MGKHAAHGLRTGIHLRTAMLKTVASAAAGLPAGPHNTTSIPFPKQNLGAQV